MMRCRDERERCTDMGPGHNDIYTTGPSSHQPPGPTVRVGAGVTFGGRVEESSLLDRAVCVS